jgi:hypothetical protein
MVHTDELGRIGHYQNRLISITFGQAMGYGQQKKCLKNPVDGTKKLYRRPSMGSRSLALTEVN